MAKNLCTLEFRPTLSIPGLDTNVEIILYVFSGISILLTIVARRAANLGSYPAETGQSSLSSPDRTATAPTAS